MSTTPNMNLTLPSVSVTIGPDWASDLNTALTVVDEHDHTSGKGVQIVPSALNLNANVDFQNNDALNLHSIQLENLGASLTGTSNVGRVYEVSGDLWWTNSSGTAVQVTAGNAIASTPTTMTAWAPFNTLAGDLSLSNGDTSRLYISVDTSAARAITLPTAASVAAGRIYIIKDATGTAHTHNITVNRHAASSDTIDGATSKIIDSNYGSLQLVSDGVSQWLLS